MDWTGWPARDLKHHPSTATALSLFCNAGWMLSDLDLIRDASAAPVQLEAEQVWLTEPRASVNLARPWPAQGRSDEAHAQPAPIHRWFMEGLDRSELNAAHELLKALAMVSG